MSSFSPFWRHWRTLVCNAFAGVLAMGTAVAAGPKPEPRVFKPGHYRLADGVLHSGSLFLANDNELLVKSENAAEPQSFGAVQVRNFVIGTDSFAVLRKFDVVINGVASNYPCAMVRVYQAAGGLELYGLKGTMDVYTATNSHTVLGGISGLRSAGLAGAALGAATGALLDKNSGEYQQQVLTVMLLRTPGHPEIQTLQPKTQVALDLLETAVADHPELRKAVHRLFPSECTIEKMVELVAQYTAARKG